MGIHRGSNIIRSGLEFAFDTGYTSVLSNKDSYIYNQGEPTTNLFSSPNFTNHTDVTVGTTSIVKQDFGGGKIGIRMIQVGTSDIASFSMGSYSAPTSAGTYTWSSFIHSTSTGGKVKAQVTVYVNGTRHWLTSSNTWTTSVTECTHLFTATVANQWHRIENQFTLPTGTLTNLQLGSFYRTTSNFTIKLANAQFELKSHTTPFTVSSRSSTASLLDITRQSTIDLSNVSFDSTAHMTFDGTDDKIDLTLPQNFQDKLTIETWYKGTDSSRNHLWNFTGSGNLNCNFNDGSYTLWLYWDGGGSNYLRFTTPQFCDSEIHHIVFVHEGSTNKVYLDGVLLTNGVAGGTQTFNSKIGSTYDVGGSPYFEGDVYVNRVYNNALSAAEVKQNFSAYRDRFNI